MKPRNSRVGVFRGTPGRASWHVPLPLLSLSFSLFLSLSPSGGESMNSQDLWVFIQSTTTDGEKKREKKEEDPHRSSGVLRCIAHPPPRSARGPAPAAMVAAAHPGLPALPLSQDPLFRAVERRLELVMGLLR